MKLTFLQKRYLQDLKYISKLLEKYKPFVFYGTLLGITREKNLIKNDDDVDILVDIKYRKKVITKLNKIKNFKINKKITNKYFVQFINNKNNIETFIDFYFYINNKNKKYIIEKHNWLSTINSKDHEIHVPKKLVFPLKKIKGFKNIFFPNQCHDLCNFLYGNNWKSPLKKNTGYRMEIINNRPKLIERSFLGSITRLIKSYF